MHMRYQRRNAVGGEEHKSPLPPALKSRARIKMNVKRRLWKKQCPSRSARETLRCAETRRRANSRLDSRRLWSRRRDPLNAASTVIRPRRRDPNPRPATSRPRHRRYCVTTPCLEEDPAPTSNLNTGGSVPFCCLLEPSFVCFK